MSELASLPVRFPAPAAEPDLVVRLSAVTVRNLPVMADIGVYPHEIGFPQELIVHVTLRVRPARAERLEETLDYTAVVAAAQALASERIGLIESFAYRLAEACLRHPVVEEADVLVEKPGALIAGLAGARVVLGRPAT